MCKFVLEHARNIIYTGYSHIFPQAFIFTFSFEIIPTTVSKDNVTYKIPSTSGTQRGMEFVLLLTFVYVKITLSKCIEYQVLYKYVLICKVKFHNLQYFYYS